MTFVCCASVRYVMLLTTTVGACGGEVVGGGGAGGRRVVPLTMSCRVTENEYDCISKRAE